MKISELKWTRSKDIISGFFFWVVILSGFSSDAALAKDTAYGAKSKSAEINSLLRQRKTSLLSGVNVGYKVLSLSGGTKVAIWYPTEQTESKYEYLIGPNKIETTLALDAPVNSGIHPLVVYAHGAVGSGLSSFFLTEALARKGYIVAAPDFLDPVYASRIGRAIPSSKKKKEEIWGFLNSLRDQGLSKNASKGREKFAYRPNQLNQSIDLMLNLDKDRSSIFYGKIDTKSIGLVGHSFGSWAAILVSGAEPMVSKHRIGALVSLSGPSNRYVFRVNSKNDLARVHTPVMFQYGDREKLFKKRYDYRNLYKKSHDPRVLACIADCNHFTFSCGSGKEFSIASDYILKSDARVAICDLTIGFLDTFLKQKLPASKFITAKSLGVAKFRSSVRVKK